MTPRRATSLRPGQFKHLIRVASVTGGLPERDVMLLWLTHTSGIRVTELALLEIGDVLYPSGAIKPEVYLRADITKGCRPRNVYLTHAQCLAALDAWLVVRYQRCWGLSGADEYRRYSPDSKLVMTHEGQAFELAFKHRQLDSGPVAYRACDALQQTITRLCRQAGIKQGSSHSGRRSLAAKVLAATGGVETVQTILGHACLDLSKPYLSVDQIVIRRAFEIAL
ncbi:site-specific integrase [Pseudomonas sp. MF6787]|uniref:site-specific integrase n=1 Tax=Pseudomonas sp. MF6787 TaxID=2797536 RepID=UPI0018E8737D|nr:site-specific integrase [Pseudomonas sp. MF6787]MBJ2264266.1 site-specific integrase [Pseudomonas sp. MF6787]